MKPFIKIFSNAQALGKAVSEELVHTVDRSPKSKNSFYIALPGGRTPHTMYEYWASPSIRNALFWQGVHFFWGDERCVPPDHPESNFRMAQEAFLSQIMIPDANIHRIRGENQPQSEVRRYEKEMRDHLPLDKHGSPRFDWIF
jgi:6-phosphogluconolactonase